jgi:hypothetical protein
MKTYILFPIALVTVAAPALAQQQPTLLFTPPSSPPISSQAPPDQGAPPPPAAPVQPEPPPAPAARVFCGQNVTAQAADPRSVPDPYRQLCAALVVEKISDDGTATITYAFGPLEAGDKTPGGVLHGTGIVKDGALLFQNSDGSQYVFQPFYSDLAGKWTTPRGQTYEAVFKRSF